MLLVLVSRRDVTWRGVCVSMRRPREGRGKESGRAVTVAVSRSVQGYSCRRGKAEGRARQGRAG